MSFKWISIFFTFSLMILIQVSFLYGALPKQTIRLLTLNETISVTIRRHAADYMILHPEIDIIVDGSSRNTLEMKIANDLLLAQPDYDAYIGSPQWISEFVGCEECPGGFDEFTGSQQVLIPLDQYLRRVDESFQYWDILPFWANQAYSKHIYQMPFDGDMHFLSYRSDILDRFNQTLPSTWEDYLIFSQFLMSLPAAQRDWNDDGTPDYAFCITNAPDDVAWYWPWTIAASSLQYLGTSQGLFFTVDPSASGEAIFRPNVLSVAFERALHLFKSLSDTGPPFPASLLEIRNLMIEGRCAFSLDWGDTIILANSSVYRDYILARKTPGSEVVMVNDKLVKCTLELCPFASIDTNGRLINYAPFSAFGGWCGYIPAAHINATSELVLNFFTWLGDPIRSLQDVTRGDSGFQIYRYSHLDKSAWLEANFSPNSILLILNNVKEVISHPNIAVDLKIPLTNNYSLVIDPLLPLFLHDQLTANELMAQAATSWNQITRTIGFEAQANSYLLSLGLPSIIFRHYQPLDEGAQISILTVASVVIFLNAFFALLILIHREHRIIKWSSVPFLWLMLLGSTVLMIGVIVPIANVSDANCTTGLILIVYGLFFMLSNIFVRTFRLWYIFLGLRRGKRHVVTDLQLFLILLLIMSIISVLLIIWCAIDHPVATYSTTGLPPNEYTYICTSPSYHWEFFGTTCACFGVLLAAGALLTWRTRMILRSLNEARFLILSLYNFCALLALLIVIVLSISDVFLVVILVAYIFIFAAISTTLIILVPKFYGIYAKADISLYFDDQPSGLTGKRTNDGPSPTVSSAIISS